MSGYLKRPQLPDCDVRAVAMGECYCQSFAAALEKLGVETFSLNPIVDLDHRLRGHADLLLLHLGGDLFIGAAGLVDHNFIPIKYYVNLNDNDAALNSCVFGDTWIGSRQHAAWQPGDGLVIAVKQRYTRCSICVVNERNIITADHGIAVAAAAAGLDVLEIRPGYIELTGFNYGFIGGASFKIAPDKLAFTGSLKAHPDEQRIVEFLKQRHVEPIYLKNEPLSDIGSAVLLW